MAYRAKHVKTCDGKATELRYQFGRIPAGRRMLCPPGCKFGKMVRNPITQRQGAFLARGGEMAARPPDTLHP